MSARDAVIAKLKADKAPQLVERTFLYYYDQLTSGSTGMLDKSNIAPLDSAPDIEQLPNHSDNGVNALRNTAVLKLNGGLGTSMGLHQAKSLLPVRKGLSFLDIIAEQIIHLRKKLDCPLPLILMNSFSTDEDTKNTLKNHPELLKGQTGIPLTFLQNRIPKIAQDSLAPVEWPRDPEKEWCPPGHGDLYTAMLTTGILEKLLANDIQFLFVSNSDNLGATLDLNILGYFAEKELPFMMEVADRTMADKKGGHVAQKRSGGLLLRESAQCPEEEKELFQNIKVFKYFNTNNLWINLPALYDMMQQQDGILGLPLIRNSKTVDPSRNDSPAVFQLETAMGAALGVFDNADVLRVPRTRFAPVKTTDDLLALWSDCFILQEDMTLIPNPARTKGTININLDPEYFKLIDRFLPRFPFGAPSLLDCSSLLVKGDVLFGPKVIIKGEAVVDNSKPEQLIIENCKIGEASL